MQKMGEIRVKLKLENDGDAQLCGQGKLSQRKVRRAVVEAIVDTGAVMTLLPQELVEKLGLPIIDRIVVDLADEPLPVLRGGGTAAPAKPGAASRRVEMDKAGGVLLTIGDRRMVASCLIGPPGCEPLVGQLVMEELDLIADPRRRRLTPRPESPYRATLKMKPLDRLSHSPIESRHNGAAAPLAGAICR